MKSNLVSLSRAREFEILESIIVASENDPSRPEFPPERPSFPATPTVRIEVSGFQDVSIKDESANPTGTHKDRMAWEIIVTYRDFLRARRINNTREPLPAMSIISSGSAAVAVQRLLRLYKLPDLRVLVDVNINPEIHNSLEMLGCEVYRYDLSRKELSWQEILSLTNNPNGFDITSNKALDPTTRFYDWLSYEILNNSPDYCFIPFGTGTLYENILNINKRELSTEIRDPRFTGDPVRLSQCHFLGATTSDPNSLADKLYSPHLPFVHYDEQWIKLYRYSGFCGSESNVYPVHESFLKQAMELAQSQNILAEPSGIASLALLLQQRNEIPNRAKILVVNTGRARLESD